MVDLTSALTEVVQASLSLLLDGNAVFLAERLHAAAPSDESTLLLATAHYHARDIRRAHAVLKDHHPSVPARYLYAWCCWHLDDLQGVECVLLPPAAREMAAPYTRLAEWMTDVPNGAAGLYLLGLVCKKSGRREDAVVLLRRAIAHNPFLWCAFEELCNLGEDLPATTVFRVSDLESCDVDMPSTTSKATGPEMTEESPALLEDAHAPTTGDRFPSVLTPIPFGEGTTGTFMTPSPGGWNIGATFTTPLPSAAAAAAAAAAETPSSPSTLSPSFGRRKGIFPGRLFPPSAAPDSPCTSSKRQSRGSFGGVSGGIEKRGSGRTLLRRVASQTTMPGAGKLDHNPGRRGSGPLPSSPRTRSAVKPLSIVDPHRSTATPLPDGGGTSGRHELMSLLQVLGNGYRHLCQYRCTEAVRNFRDLSREQHQTGWVLSMEGRALVEAGRHQEARKVFQEARRLERYRLRGMEVYSNLLWHLKCDVDLAFLAQEAVEFSRLAPETWVIVGNCFSIQKEHETALRFFKRALQIDPQFVFAHTLSGHECVVLEDFEKAMVFYRNAIRIDPRHYNAWGGLGNIYYRQEKYDMAEYHFRVALSINPQSSVICCYMGMVLHAMKKYQDALHMLERAIELNERNAIAKLKKSSVLVSIGDLGAALTELDRLKDIAPKEPSVYIQMGMIYRRLKMPEQAIQNFMIAVDLEPKRDHSQIKAALEGLQDLDPDESVSL